MSRLAVITAQLGTISETFVRRHVEDIAPGRTVAVAQRFSHPTGGRWEAPGPALFLDRRTQSLAARLGRRAGVSAATQRANAVERFLRAHAVTVVLGEYLDQFVEFVPLLDRMGVPYVVQGHGIDLSASLRDPALARRYLAYASARAVLTRCEFHRQRLIALGLSPDKVHVNPGGVDIPHAVPTRAPGAGGRFLAIGRMVAKKGPILLLEAFRRAAADNGAITLDWVGGGEFFGAAQQFVQATGLDGRVRLHGMAPEADKHALLASCGVFVQHSLTDPRTGDEEGLPAAIQEAMAHGMAVISTRHAGIPDAVEDGVSGLLVDEGDAPAMAGAMLRLAGDPGAVEAFGAAGRAKAAACYSWEAERSRLLGHLGLADPSPTPMERP